MKKRLLAAALALCMLMSLLPTTALAAGDPEGQSDSVHAEDNGVVVNKTVTADGNGGYSLTMEAYVTNEVKQSSQTTPLDIVLVLDISGSMENQIGDTAVEYESTGNRSWTYGNIDRNRTTYYFRDDNGDYHKVEARRDWDGRDRDWVYSIGYYTGEQWHRIGATGNEQNSTLWSGTLYTRQVSTTSKMEAMQSAVNSFISQVAGNAADAGDAATHRISIVKFADDSYADRIGNDRQNNSDAYNYTQIVKDFTAVDTAGVAELTGAINELVPAGATSVDYGLTLAQDVLDGEWRHDDGEWWVEDPELTGAREGAKQVVVVFTDGEPNHSSDFDDTVAATAVNLAKELKDGGVTVYTVGVFDDADPSNMERDFNKYMHGVSSNYPEATAVGSFWGTTYADWSSLDLGTRVTEGNYYLAADNAAALEDAFDTIASEMSKYNVTAGTSTVLFDTLSGNFAFPAGLTGSSEGVTVQYAEVTGQAADGAYTWAEPETLENVTPVVSGKTITVTGFDYSKNAVTKTTAPDGTVTWTGGKLILTFPIQPDQNGEWTDAAEYPTNDTGDSKAGLSGFTVDKTPGQSLELKDSPKAPVTTYSVTYEKNADDATGMVADGKHYITGGTATVVDAEFSHPGYNFTGWNTAADGTGTGYEAGDSIPIGDADVTLYAQWESATAGYTVEYYKQNFEDDEYTLVEADTLTPSGNIGEEVTAPGRTYDGFTFNAEKSNQTGTITADGNLVLKMYYDWTRYTVRYEYEGTVPEGAPELPDPRTYKHGTEVAVAAEPSLDGYDFHGWYSDQPEVNGDLPDGTITVPQYDVVIKGAFTAQGEETYTVTYDLNGGTIQQSGTTYIPLEYRGLHYGDDTPMIPDPTKVSDGSIYEFTGWEPEVSEKVTGDVTYVAQYEKTEEQTAYTVTYLLNGETYGEVEEYRVGEGVVVRPQVENATPWVTDDLEEGAIVGGGFTMPANDVVFTATIDDCSYSVISHYIDRDGTEIASVPETGVQTGTVGTPVAGLFSTTNDTLSDGQKFIFDRATLNGETISGGETLVKGDNYIDVYYDSDEIGPNDGPDDVSDKDQVIFTYQTEDMEKGVLKDDSGDVEEIVLVVTKGSDGSAYAPYMPAYANEGYEFDEWRDELPAYYDEDTTFTAYFKTAGEEPEEPRGPILVYFEAVNGCFRNESSGAKIETYNVVVMPDENGDYYLAADDMLTAVPYSEPSEASWTFNGEPCEAPEIGTQVYEDGDTFVVKFSDGEEPTPEMVTLRYEWIDPAPALGTPDGEEVEAGSTCYVEYPSEQVADAAGSWKFLGWFYDEDGTSPCNDREIVINEDTTLYGEWEFLGGYEEPDPGEGSFLVEKYSDQTSVTVGDAITWTIIIASMTDEDLTVRVEDKLAGTTLTDADGNPVTGAVTVPGWGTVTLYAAYQTDLDDADTEIVNTVVVTNTENPDDTVEEKDDGVEVEPYEITITPADIVIYTGGTGYSNVLDENGKPVSETSQGLPEPGYHIDLPDGVENWLEEHGVNMDEAADLADVLSFRYYNEEGTVLLRRWDLEDQGVYSRNGDTVTAYVYSLSANKVEDQDPTKVRLQFTDDGAIVTTDNIRMDENTVSARYKMTIYGGGLDQSKIQTVFTAPDGETLVCSVDIGTGDLLVKSTTDSEYTNGIGTVDNRLISAAANEGVTYFVNNSEVKVAPERVELLVDSVSNDAGFNSAMGADAISEVTAKHGSLTRASYELAYMDLVDTKNGNAVVTLGTDDALTIYWPMPDDADEDGAFYIVHYTGMDREDLTAEDDLASAVNTVERVYPTSGDGHLTFTVKDFSPFALVYERESTGGGGSSRPSRPTLNTEDHYSYIIGYSDGYLRPYGTITRGEVATIFFRLLTDDTREEYWSQVNDYSDCDSDLWCNNAISTLSSMGIIDGFSDGTFRPYARITRAQFAKIAVGFFETAREDYQGRFTDVDTGAWYTEYVEAAARVGLIQGFSDGTFRPNENITRAQACVIVNRALGRAPHEDRLLDEDEMLVWPDNNPGDWFYADMQEATNSHDYTWTTVDGDKVEKWTDKLAQRDWAALENAWSTAHSAPGGEVTE